MQSCHPDEYAKGAIRVSLGGKYFGRSLFTRNRAKAMEENEVNQILKFVRDNFRIKSKTWDDIEEDEPTPDEVDAIEQYHSSK